jgi:flagellar motor switch protein FliG
MSDIGIQKSAMLLLTLGENEAAEVMKHLDPREVQKISTAMVSISNLSREQIADVFEEFHLVAAEKTTVGMNSNDYIRRMLNKALGDDKAVGLLDRIMQGDDTSGIESLKWMDPAQVAELVGGEHPQIIATILVHLDRDQASEVIGYFTERTRNDVVLRIATLDGIQPTALRELNDVLTKLLSGSENIKRSPMGGIRATAEILNFLGSVHEESVIESIKGYDTELAQKIIDQMFVFENLLDVEDRGIQLLLKGIESESLIIALKGARPELRDKFLKNMSQRAADLLREDLESRGPVRVSEVEGEQKKILQIVRRLSDAGEIVLGGKADDAYV